MVAGLEGDSLSITEQIGDKDFAMVIVRPCLKGSVLDCLMWTSTWLGEWELGTSVMSLEAAFLLPTNLPLKRWGVSIPYFARAQFVR